MVMSYYAVDNCTEWRETKYHSIAAVLRIGTRSLIKRAAGMPVARVIRPSVLNVQAMPVFWIRASTMKLMTAPPSPPPAYTIPLAIPRLALKYWAGITDTTYTGEVSLANTTHPLRVSP